MADCDIGQVDSVPNQYGVYLDFIFFITPLLKLDRHHPAFSF
jgi:hypothetical protein